MLHRNMALFTSDVSEATRYKAMAMHSKAKDLGGKAKALSFKAFLALRPSPRPRLNITAWGGNLQTEMILLVSACHWISFLCR